jgi:hypothetical protein
MYEAIDGWKSQEEPQCTVYPQNYVILLSGCETKLSYNALNSSLAQRRLEVGEATRNDCKIFITFVLSDHFVVVSYDLRFASSTPSTATPHAIVKEVTVHTLYAHSVILTFCRTSSDPIHVRDS